MGEAPGRPPHLVTEEKRNIVMQLCAFDWSLERIAAALSITPPTLRKNYFRELKAKAEARARVEAKLLAALMAEADKGNVAAIDKYFKRLDKHDINTAAPRQQAKPPTVGKKAAKVAKAKAAPDSQGWGSLVN